MDFNIEMLQICGHKPCVGLSGLTILMHYNIPKKNTQPRVKGKGD